MRVAGSSLVRGLVRERTESVQFATVLILRGATGELDRSTGLVGGMTNPRRVYSGQARIRSVNGNRTESIGGGEVVQRDTIVTIPIDAPVPQRDDVVLIGVNDEADATVDTLSLRVLGADAGGFFGDGRRLSCVGFGKSRAYQG